MRARTAAEAADGMKPKRSAAKCPRCGRVPDEAGPAGFYCERCRFHWTRDDVAAAERSAEGRSASSGPRRQPERRAQPRSLPADAPTVDDQAAAALTDLGNAKRFAAMHRDVLRHVTQWGWVVFDGRRWPRDEDGAAMRLTESVVRSLYREAAEAPRGDRKAIADHARRSESLRARKAMLESAASELDLVAHTGDFDGDPWALNVVNGTLDLRSGELRAHRSADLITRLAPVRYDAKARHPTWERYLAHATAGDADLQAYLQRAAGYMLSGSTGEECFFLLLGPAATGKSTFVEALLSVLGDYATTSSFDTFLEHRDVGTPRPDLARLAGARLVAACETSASKRLAEEVVKRLTGGDTISARYLFRDEFSFRPVCKLVLAANDAPRIKDTDSGIWRRLRRIPFERALDEDERDPAVKATLTKDPAALRAILAWAVAGCLEWQRDGLGYPEVIRRKSAELRASFDPLAAFFADRCQFGEGFMAAAGDLRRAYESWADVAGEKAINNREWGDRLAANGCVQERQRVGGRQLRYWHGIGLVAETVAA
ncbi:MAG: phage/plasmid primase, P4 family [Anaerolineae bacterium]